MNSQSKATIALIAAVARNGAIGRNNQLLVHLPGDLPRFKRMTAGHPVLMGRKTWDSIGRPLPGRRNIVITRNSDWQHAGAERASSIDEAMDLSKESKKIFVIGGAEIYVQAMPHANELVLTEIDDDFEGDAFFPAWDRTRFRELDSEGRRTPDGLAYRYVTYRRIEDCASGA